MVPTQPIKDAAIRTPLAGALQRSRNYFAGSAPYGGTGAYASPARLTCQSNYVVLATDGNPTGKTDGTAYTNAERTNTQGTNGAWSFGTAARDVFTEINALKTLSAGNITNGVQTYVVGMGDTVANAGSVAVLNEMASQGGTGAAYVASTSDALAGAFQRISDQINVERLGAGSSVTLNSPYYQGGSALYQATFSSNPSWTGDIASYAVDSRGDRATSPAWLASAQIIAQNWNTGRAILTYRPATAAVVGSGVPFRWPVDPAAPTINEIGADQMALLDTNPSGTLDGSGNLRLAYLRGDTSREARNCSGCALKFHDRITKISGTPTPNVLGDIVDSAPLYVGPPNSGYDDSIESVSYSSFVSTHSGRLPYLYVGANDGMLHAIDAKTGKEQFAYVPNLVYSALSRQTAQRYAHQFTVNGTPTVGDVLYGGAWHSLLVSGLRSGGKGLFALDVTDPTTITEATAGSVVRWEVPGFDADVGYIFAQPALVKTNNGRWSVIVGNGYNSSTATAQLLVIDAENGSMTKLNTGAAGMPNGLSEVTPVDTDNDGTVDVVYAGDLDGNLWKFDLTSSLPGSWFVVGGAGVPLFAAGPTKPITARPDVARHPKGGYIVTFATGRYLTSGDVGATDGQTAYGIWDKGGTTTITLTQLQQQKIEPGTVTATDGSEYRFSTHRVGAASDTVLQDDLVSAITVDSFYGTKLGWYMDLPTSGERVVAAPTIRGNRAIFTSIIPVVAGSDACDPRGSGWITEVDLLTGNRLTSPTFDTNNDSLLDASDRLRVTTDATGTNTTTSWRINGIPSAPAFLTVKTGADSAEIKYVNTSSGTVQQKREGPGTGGQRRVMWRVVQ